MSSPRFEPRLTPLTTRSGLRFEEAEHAKTDAVRRRPVGHVRVLPGTELGRTHSERAVQRDAVARAAPVPLGGDDVNVADRGERVGEGTERVRFDPVVVCDEYLPAPCNPPVEA